MEEWYWVRNNEDRDWFPAKRDSSAVGGWTNEDTWEDFDNSINQWVKIPSPSKCLEIDSEKKASEHLNSLKNQGCY